MPGWTPRSPPTRRPATGAAADRPAYRAAPPTGPARRVVTGRVVRLTLRLAGGQRGPSNVLLVQNLRDPATPYSKALNLRAALGDRARLVSVDAGGHGSYLDNGNACGDARVTAFLADGVRPARDVTCPAQP
jgi:pimeloyl-ACP methyl ester carboxylesterase